MFFNNENSPSDWIHCFSTVDCMRDQEEFIDEIEDCLSETVAKLSNKLSKYRTKQKRVLDLMRELEEERASMLTKGNKVVNKLLAKNGNLTSPDGIYHLYGNDEPDFLEPYTYMFDEFLDEIKHRKDRGD